MKRKYPKTLNECLSYIEELHAYIEELEIYSGDGDTDKLQLEAYRLQLYIKKHPEIFKWGPTYRNGVRFLIAIAHAPKLEMTKQHMFDIMISAGKGASEDTQVKIVDVCACAARKLLIGSPYEGDIDTIWGVGYKTTQKLKDYIKEIIHGQS